MINVIVNVIVVLAMLWCSVRLLRIALGIRALRLSRCKFSVLENMRGGGDPAADRGVSVIVAGLPAQKRIERLMGLNFENYEVVIVADMLSAEHSREIIRRYSMTRVNVPVSAEFPCDAVRTLFRSRQRRYRKLVMADCAAPLHEALNCGLALSSFGRVVVMNSRTCLGRNALLRMDAEFESSSVGMVCAVSAPIIDIGKFGCDTAVEIVAGEYSHHVSMIDRDYAISIGGFSAGDDCMARMLSDLSDIPGLKLSFVPAPLDTGSDYDRTFRISNTRITVYLLLCITAVATLLSVLARRWDLITTLILTLWMLYWAMVAAGILSLSALKRDIGTYPLRRMLLEPFVYPFYPHKGSLMEKNFSKS